MTDPIPVAVLTFIVVATAAALIYKRLSSELHAKLKESSEQTNEAERQVHLKEMEYLAERNKAEIESLRVSWRPVGLS
ncbi:hypothetical protein [Limnohabitans sp.]|uniref:hypothetical protein n=1 Tax=Limnohabitans sp. TaxID=1907725 RepID=UPI0025BA3E43|nr:hypothetical protein [Limnohabitans sp.]